MKNQTFVFLHDENLYFNIKKFFDCFENLKYVFLGEGDTNQIQNFDDVIIARNLPCNIEVHKNLTAYTGWYAVWKNNLVQSDYVNFFEYDVIFKSDIQKFIYDTLYKYPKIKSISYQSISIQDYWFLSSDLVSSPFLDRLQYYYDFNGRQFINSFPANIEVGITSNQTIEKNVFTSFMKWIEPVMDDLKFDYMAGHYPERCLPLYILKNLFPSVICQGVLHHLRLDSHGTQGIKEEYKLANAVILKSKNENLNVVYKTIKKIHL